MIISKSSICICTFWNFSSAVMRLVIILPRSRWSKARVVDMVPMPRGDTKTLPPFVPRDPLEQFFEFSTENQRENSFRLKVKIQPKTLSFSKTWSYKNKRITIIGFLLYPFHAMIDFSTSLLSNVIIHIKYYLLYSKFSYPF